MSNLTPPAEPQQPVNALVSAIEKLVSSGDAREEKLEKRLGDRIGRIEEKIDQALEQMSKVFILNSRVEQLDKQVNDNKTEIRDLTKAVEALKTWRSILSACIAILGTPIAIYALNQLLNRAG